MSVTSSVVLPAQPAVGSLSFVPLGGNGLLAPLSMYEAVVSLATDASAGTALIRIICDPRYASMILYLSSSLDSGGAARVHGISTRGSGGSAGYTRTAVNDTSLAPTQQLTWSPPPAVLLADPQGDWIDAVNPSGLPEARFQVDNVTGDGNVILKVGILNFNLEAPHRVPYGHLLQNFAPSSQP